MKETKIFIRNNSNRLIYFILEIQRGSIVLPKIERNGNEFTIKQKIDLLNSIKNNYPIGTILFWKPNVHFECENKVGNYDITQHFNYYNYILDGYQRLSFLYNCLENPIDSKTKEFKTNINNVNDLVRNDLMYYDSIKEEFFLPDESNAESLEPHQVPLYVLINTFSFIDYGKTIEHYDNYEDLFYKAQRLGTALIDFTIPTCTINGGTIDQMLDMLKSMSASNSSINL